MTESRPAHGGDVGEPIDLAAIDRLVLGDVWAVAEAVSERVQGHVDPDLAARTATAVAALVAERRTAFRGLACENDLARMADEAEDRLRNALVALAAADLARRACFVLARCDDLAFAGLGTAAARLLSTMDRLAVPHFAVTVARLADPASVSAVVEQLTADLSGSPLLADEVRILAAMDLREALLTTEAICRDPGYDDPAATESRHPPSDILDYARFARSALEHAAARMRAIHDGGLPYAADKGFTVKEARVLARAARVSLDRDEPWLPSVLDELFHKVSLAPGTAKTMPSQSVAITLGRAVEALPTPEAVATLRSVLRAIRHAGVEKKLQRYLRTAERMLGKRPKTALRVPLDQPLSKSQLATLTRALEASLGWGAAWGYDEWRVHLAEHPHAGKLAERLLWRVHDTAGRPTAVLPTMGPDGLSLRDLGGGIVMADPTRPVSLWHPLDANDEDRAAWRDHLVAETIKQPFKQAFREHYTISHADLSQSESAMFSGHGVSLRHFAAVLRQQGWRVLDGGCRIAREIGRWTVTFDVEGDIHPNAIGWARTGEIKVWVVRGPQWLPAQLGDLPPVALSEALRSVDLLVSVSSFALTPPPKDGTDDEHSRLVHLKQLSESPLGPMARMRKEAIARVIGTWPDAGRTGFDARHLRVGPFAIHLATGRVTRDGEPVSAEPPGRSTLAAVPWLPYDEKLLEFIVSTAATLLSRSDG